MINFEKICRTCSSEGELQSLFIKDPFLIADMLSKIADIKVNQNDSFPQNICAYCVDQLKSAYYFIQQCQDVNNKLQEHLDTQSYCKIEEMFEENTNMKNESVDEYSQKLNSYAMFEFYIDNTDSIDDDIEDITLENSTKNSLAKQTIKTIECGICLKSLNQNSLRQHLKTHSTERPYVCPVCSKDFTLKIEFKVHMRKHKDVKPFQCNHCEKSFKQRRSLLHHLNVTHLDVIKEKFPIKNRLKAHRNVECTICLKSMGSNNLRRHLLSHTGERPFGCSICGKNFTQKIQLDIHMRIHTGERPFKCNLCENSFVQRGSLLYHLKVKHAEEIKSSPSGEFECKLCEEKFSSKIILASHKLLHKKGTRKVRQITATTKSYLCNHCGKAFSTNMHLQDHIGTHTGEKRHKCDMCEKSFAAYSVFHVHRRTHLGVKPYKCTNCEKSFVTKSYLNRHKRTHTGDRPFKCEICNQRFRNREHLKYHSYTHTGEKRYTCSECDKGFYDMGTMNRHKKIHRKHSIANRIKTEHAYN